MSSDLSDILKELNSGQNPTPGQGTGGGTTSSQRSDGTTTRDFGLRSINESGNGKKKP